DVRRDQPGAGQGRARVPRAGDGDGAAAAVAGRAGDLVAGADRARRGRRRPPGRPDGPAGAGEPGRTGGVVTTATQDQTERNDVDEPQEQVPGQAQEVAGERRVGTIEEVEQLLADLEAGTVRAATRGEDGRWS